jgi:hypothetical protein
LQVIACGDFAYGRNGRLLHNIFVCRNEQGARGGDRVYRVFDARDEERRHDGSGSRWCALIGAWWRLVRLGLTSPKSGIHSRVSGSPDEPWSFQLLVGILGPVADGVPCDTELLVQGEISLIDLDKSFKMGV